MVQTEKPTAEQVKNIISSTLLETATSVTDTSKGCDQHVFVVETTKRSVVIKFSKEEDKLFPEAFATSKLQGIVPVPKLLYFHDDFLIQEFIPGKDLEDEKVSEEEWKSIFFQLGTFLKKMHSIKLEGFGKLNKEGQGAVASWKENIHFWLEKELKRFEEVEVLSGTELNTFKQYLTDNEPFLETNESVLLHCDVEGWNIRINNKEISGIIDFGDCEAGPAMYDFARCYLHHFDDGGFDAMRAGYGFVDQDQIKYYAALLATWMIPHHMKNNNTALVLKEQAALQRILKKE
ncbi:MAG: aminoglycoside phosphotransferase family protein [Candidatus Woesearchaeota archaeon]|nr:MAG: aminoglycoside phosphotransferase family protein [Candidatus Woesearchaeota archaeon]